MTISVLKMKTQRAYANDDDIYNFDETGFAMGLISTARIVVRRDFYGRKPFLQPGNREWVTAIESISATGFSPPSCNIFQGSIYDIQWATGLPDDWRFEVSKNGWTTDKISLRWLEKLFIPATTTRTRGRYRLLILDGHGSHLTPRFDQNCKENNIIPICMPAQSSHLLQPLDIGCFAMLKRSYYPRLGYNHINKRDFLESYPQARHFAAAGLVPINAERVLSKLNISLCEPTPPASRPSSRSSIFTPKTPHTAKQLAKQASSIKRLQDNVEFNIGGNAACTTSAGEQIG
ncbi:uncharacterized protein N7503_006485 [Penicillium pulvis]|uniref:uncharacterized protein n=1 Tax=Penicillium pulvis TaxID=1562058 RepID=UPI002546EAAD|nr:uncharacterized protein N7503_006485 [Penicillium pulvis]KAJ5798980.1 hypothetical protein N7503_006485 [Penicillium pulvis]